MGGMKIARVETHVCHARMRNWVFVKVVTDQHGLFGWGEATLEWHTRAVVGAVQDCAELIGGEDPTRIEHLWQMMYRQHFWHGHGIVRATAIAGIDLALWDIFGKVCECFFTSASSMTMPNPGLAFGFTRRPAFSTVNPSCTTSARQGTSAWTVSQMM